MNGQVEPDNWKQWLARFIGRPVNALELGSFNGTSAVWLLQHILTHPDSRLTCVDSLEGIPSLPELKEDRLRGIFFENTKPWSQQVRLIAGRTTEVLPLMVHQGLRFDFFYIDASHIARDVLFDAVLCYQLSKEGSVIIFDDYDLQWTLEELPCRVGVDAFLSAHDKYVRVIGKGYQLAADVFKR